MITIPQTQEPLVLRTDFSNEGQWTAICTEIVTPHPEYGFIPYVEFISDIHFQNFTEEMLNSHPPTEYQHAFIFLVDDLTFSNPEHPILCIGLLHNKGMKFRTLPSEMWCVENNLSISNMDFENFIDQLDENGIYRGFM